jgi:hypothetical protein
MCISCVYAERGANVDSDPQGIGQMPYEMQGRKEDRSPILTFGDCSVWTVESEGAKASLYRSQDQRMFDYDSGKLTFEATADKSSILLRHDEGIPLSDPWDSISIWIYGNSWQYGETVGPLDMDLILRGADGVFPPEVMDDGI